MITTAASSDADGVDPEFWAVSFEHDDATFAARDWRTDIGLSRVSPYEHVFSLALWHSIAPGYLGTLPPPPVPSSPRIVRQIMETRSAFAGSLRLRATPEPLHVGEGKEWIAKLMLSDRRCPLIFVSRDHGGNLLVDPARMARQLAGVASVVEAEGQTLDEELRFLLPRALRCWEGAVRVYLPGVDQDEDGRRHRFFAAEKIHQVGAEAAENTIIEALARRSPTVVLGALTTLHDVELRKREARLAELRKGAESAAELRELLPLFERESADLRDQVKGLTSEAAQLTERAELAELEKEELTDQLHTAKSDIHRERSRAVQAEGRVRQLERAQTTLRDLDELPTTVREVLELVTRLHPDKLVCTERAIKSAEEAAINDAPSEIRMVWKCLQSMASVLHELHFPPDGAVKEDGSLLTRFEARTPFKLGVTESSQTKKDAKLMKLRKGTYKAEEIDVAAHVKYDSGSRFLRVHYHPHQEDRLIVIDHCGDHLDTAGTRRRK